VAAASFDWFGLVKEGGAYCAPLLLAAVLWLNADRARLLQELKERDARLETLAERVIAITTELRNFLFNERKG
jgi:hypothetical protein